MKRHIIFVCDNPKVLDTLRLDLDTELKRGYQLEFCESAGQVQDVLVDIEGHGDLLALIVWDHAIPVDDRALFLTRIAARHPETKKILLAEVPDHTDHPAGTGGPRIDRHIDQPWAASTLRSVIRELLDGFEREHFGDILGLGDLYNLGDFQRLDSTDLFAKSDAFSPWWAEMFVNPLWERPLASPCRPRIHHRRRPDDSPRPMILMASNSYLDLTTHPKLVSAAKDAIDRFGIGTGAVPLLSGTFEIHKELESALCRFKEGDACCIFPSGYSANIGIIAGLARETDTIFLDELVHASIVDGAKMSRARVRLFRHNEIDDLVGKLKDEDRRSATSGKLIIVEGVYSMDGDIAPLPQIIEAARRYGAKVMVDEAHSTGVIGSRGHGIGEHFGITGQIDIVMGTFSKTLGAVGGFCVASKSVVEYLRFYARSHMFSTSLPPATIASTLAGLEVIDEEPHRVEALKRNHTWLRNRFRALGLDTSGSETAIIPVIIGDNPTLWRMARELDQAGIYVNAVPFPAVPRELSRLRFSVMSSHSLEDLERTANTVEEIARKYHVLP